MGVDFPIDFGEQVGIRLYFWLYAGDETTRFNWKRFVPFISREDRTSKRLLIIGAGDCGEKIYREIRDNPRLGYRVVGFLDDDPEKAELKIHGIPVLGNTGDIKAIAARIRADEILIAIPPVTSPTMRALMKRCKELDIPSKTVPGMGELINGKVSVKTIRDVSYRDLLGREPVMLDEAKIGEYLKGKRVLVTGAGGSIGSELCRQVCRYDAEEMVKFRFQDLEIWKISIEIADELFDIADDLDKKRLFRFAEQ